MYKVNLGGEIAMSFDLMIFEKIKISTNQSDFLNWYNHKMECDDIQDISFASKKIQEVFHLLRNIFPPMNGSFAPDDTTLSENPEMEKYLCDYSIKEDMIYFGFSYSISEFAYNTVKRTAYFLDVGFFNPSDNCLPILFDCRCPMLLEGEWFRKKEIDSFESIREKLSSMTVSNRSYLYVTDQIGNYIQIGGYKDYFTVEKRIYMTPTTYVHYKAGYLGAEHSSNNGNVVIAGNSVKVKKNQLLSKSMAEQLFADFFQNIKTVQSIEWVEMDM